MFSLGPMFPGPRVPWAPCSLGPVFPGPHDLCGAPLTRVWISVDLCGLVVIRL